MKPIKKIGELLLERGLITASQLTQALEKQTQTNRFIGEILIESGAVPEDKLMQVLADQFEIPYVRLRDTPLDKNITQVVSLKVALHYKLMPVALKGDKLTVAISNPQDLQLLDGLRLALKSKYLIDCVLATEHDIQKAIEQYYGLGAETIDQILLKKEPGKASDKTLATDGALEDIQKGGDAEASVIKLVNQILLEAHERRATDVHFEPFRGQIRLRYRVDGVLLTVDTPHDMRRLFPAIISRIKVLSGLDLVERRIPQDGRASVQIGAQKIDLRTSILPTASGEAVVIRILPSRKLMDLQELGLEGENLKHVEEVIQKPYGLIFVTGPTGSGKSTTLYGCLKRIDNQERKIITLEDPVEYEIDGIMQVAVNPAVGLTFAKGLRSMLRHDPDIMMVGEVRDVETAQLAIRIALTGHLVFSTLHTNDAASGFTRLMDMGIDPYLLVSSIRCFVAQRLVRIICEHCKKKETYGPEGLTVWRGHGCDSCKKTGYMGRRAIYEVLMVTPAIRELVMKRVSAEEIRKRAVEEKMIPLHHAGWELVKRGITTPEEVLRMTADDDMES